MHDLGGCGFAESTKDGVEMNKMKHTNSKDFLFGYDAIRNNPEQPHPKVK